MGEEVACHRASPNTMESVGAPTTVNPMSVQQLKSELLARGIRFSHCREKSELQRLLQDAIGLEEHTKSLMAARFASHHASGRRCWIEAFTNNTEGMCYWDDGTSGVVALM